MATVQQPADKTTASFDREVLIAVAFGAVLLVIALAQALVYRQWINADSISYMDMGDAIPGANIGRLINPYWSPLYPALLGAVNAIWRPGPEWEFPAAHLVNFLCFLFAAAAFHFFLRSLWKVLTSTDSGTAGSLPGWAFRIIGYSFFLYASLGMVALMRTTPDMLMSGCLYLGAALLVRITSGRARINDFALLGVALALGYASKAIMFPLGLCVLGLTLFIGGPMRLRARRTGTAALSFALLSAPLATATSRSAHRPTFSEAGTLNYMFFVDRLDWYYQNRTGVAGHAVRTVSRINQDPPAYSFASPHNATYSLWFTPYYWSEGLGPTIQIRTQIRILLEGLRGYARTMFQLIGVALAILALCFLTAPRDALGRLRAFWPVIAMSGALMAAYLLATPKIEDRYIGAPISIIGLTLICGLLQASRLTRATLIAVVAIVALNLFARTGINMVRDYRDNENKAQRSEVDAALALKRRGLVPGTRVAAISPWISPGWARLSRLVIVADVAREQAENFWALPADRQASVLNAFARKGSTAVVGWLDKRKDVPAGWERLGPSPYVLYTLH